MADSSEKSNKLEQDVRTYCEVLASCNLPEVENWKFEDLERVFRWSAYFQKVHGRCLQRASLMEKLDKKFREIGNHSGCRFDGDPLSCNFLGSSQQYLTKALLENPTLRGELREKVLDKYAETNGKEALEDLLKHLTELDNSRKLVETLQAIHTKVKEHVENSHPGCTPQPGLVSVSATLLLEDVHWLLSLTQETDNIGGVSWNEAVVHKKLSGLVQETKGGMEVVLHSLLMAPGNSDSIQKVLAATSVEHLDVERRVILDWVLKQLTSKCGSKTSVGGSKLNSFQCKLFEECPPKLLARVSTVHFTFFQEYLQLLMTKAEELDQSSLQNIVSSHIPAPMRDQKGTKGATKVVEEKGDGFDLLIDHFKTLAQSGHQAKEVCVSLLKSKIQPPLAEKFHLPAMVGTIWNRILHAVSI